LGKKRKGKYIAGEQIKDMPTKRLWRTRNQTNGYFQPYSFKKNWNGIHSTNNMVCGSVP